MLIGNKKVSQLLNLAPDEVQTDDLFLIIDSSAKESKNIDAGQLALWLNASGSIYAIHSILADTASYILGSNVVGPVSLATLAATAISSSWADRSGHADVAESSSNATTASFALNAQGLSITSSYLQYSGFPNGTASYALSAGAAENVYTAAYLLYFGGDNGTASYAIVALSTSFCETANTASYFDNSISTVASASLAEVAKVASSSLQSYTASFLNYNGDFNGTASYALVAQRAGKSLFEYGMTDAHHQSESGSLVENLVIWPSDGIEKKSLIKVFGSAILNFTSSMDNNYSFSMFAIQRLNGAVYEGLDEVNIGIGTTPIVNMWGSETTGTLKIPFNMIFQGNLIGEYFVEVTSSSPNLQFDSRLAKFTLASTSDYADLIVDGPMTFDLQPSESVLIMFSSSLVPGVMFDYLPGLLNTGSENITAINVSASGVTSVFYTYQCTSLQYFNCSGNPISELKYYFAPSLQTLIADNCYLSRIAHLSNTTTSYVDISHNGLTRLPDLSPSTSYFKCSWNPATQLPDFPTTLTILNADGTYIRGAVPLLPEGLTTASFGETNIQDFTNLPVSLSYLDISQTIITSMSVELPPSLSWFDVSNGIFNLTALENMTKNLVDSGVVSGTFKMNGYGPPQGGLITNLLDLSTNSWTLEYDV